MLLRLALILICSTLAYLPWVAFAACSKKDVEFYLDKGFDQEQITQLCAESEASVPDYQPYQQQVIIYSEEEGPGLRDGLTRDERKAIKELNQGIDVQGLVVDQETLQFTVKICLAVQEGKDYNQRFKTCPEVFYTISRRGLVTLESGKKFVLFGKSSVRIKSSDIKRVSKQDFNNYPSRFKKQLERYFDWATRGNETNIPVRGDYSTARINNAFNALTKEADPNATLVQNDSPELAQDDVEPEKKKRWWNPFD
jgi:hypothetical protein